MRLFAIAAFCTLLAACDGRKAPQTNRAVPLAAEPALPKEAREGRLILTRAQVDEARATGTLDRPVKSLLKVDKPLHFGEFIWNDAGVLSGPVWIRIDPQSQLLSVFRDGNEIGATVIVYGGDNKQTPRGTFHILSRDKDHRSSLYDAAMPYTLQLTRDGVSIHGSTVRWGAATHGCIGVPLEFARRLFGQARVGDEVVIVAPPKKSTGARTS
jgi:hypothetical protein